MNLRADINGHYSKNTTPQAAPLVRGSGVLLYDLDGTEYLDCCSQTLNVNLGQCHPEITEAVIEQVRRLTFSSSRFSNDVTNELVSRLIGITPDTLTRVNLRNTSGSAANECAIKAARKRTGKRMVFSLMHSHHGQTAETMRISGKHFKNSYLGDRGAVFLPLPSPSSNSNILSLEDLNELWTLQDEDVAALIVEPVMVDAGVVVLTKEYLQTLRTFCTEKGIALIFDEIQTGFGWLGTLHAMDYYGVTPDIVTFGKALGAGYPLAAAVFSSEYDVLEYGEHEFTYGAHPASCAASLKMIEILQRPGFLEDVKQKSEHIRRRLNELRERFDFVTDIRGLGFIWGIELTMGHGENEGSLSTKEVVRKLHSSGLITRASKVGANSNILQFKPPLIMSVSEIDRAAEIMMAVFAEI
jgi:4-aminobutyrate aminotransferase-like enzyme